MTKSPFAAVLVGPLASKKNGKIVRRDRNGRVLGLIENARVRAAEDSLVQQLMTVTVLHKLDMRAGAVFDGDSLDLVVTIDKDTDTTYVEIQSLGPRPKGKTGRKRDKQNELTLVCDALEKARIVSNDNQFASITVKRIVGGKIQ